MKKLSLKRDTVFVLVADSDFGNLRAVGSATKECDGGGCCTKKTQGTAH